MNDSRYELKSLIHPLHCLEPTIATYLIYVHEPAMLAQWAHRTTWWGEVIDAIGHLVRASSRLLGAVAIFVSAHPYSLLPTCSGSSGLRFRWHFASASCGNIFIGIGNELILPLVSKYLQSQDWTYDFIHGWWKTWVTRRYISVITPLLIDDQSNICVV